MFKGWVVDSRVGANYCMGEVTFLVIIIG